MRVETMVTVPLSEYRDGVQARERLDNLKLIIESETYMPEEQIRAILGICTRKNDEKSIDGGK